MSDKARPQAEAGGSRSSEREPATSASSEHLKTPEDPAKLALKNEEKGHFDKLWELYWVEILVALFIVWMVVFSVGWTIRRKYYELKRKRKLQMEQGDQKALDVKIHEEVEQAIRQTLGDWSADKFKALVKYVLYSKNPLGIIFYVMMQFFGYSYAWVFLIDKYCPGPYLSDIHKPLSLVVVLGCWCTYFYVLGQKPMTCKEKLKMQALAKGSKQEDKLIGTRYEEFPYDGVHYVKD